MNKKTLIIIIIFIILTSTLLYKVYKESASLGNEINICFNIDNKYFKPLMVSIYSILKNNKSHSKLNIFILTNDLSHENRKIITDFIKKNNQNITILDIDTYPIDKGENLYSQKRYVKHISRIGTGRLLVGSALPKKIKRVLYLDADTLILDDLKPLYKTYLGENIVAMASDPPREKYKNKKQKMFYNSGVMVIDLEKWRDENIELQVINYIDRHKRESRFKFIDQTSISKVLRGKIKLLPDYTNEDASFSPKNTDHYILVLHFLGEYKPWNEPPGIPGCLHVVYSDPFVSIYKKYQKELEQILETKKPLK